MNKELDLTKLDEMDQADLIFWVKLLAGKLQKRTEELEHLKAKVSGKIGAQGKRNPRVQ